MFIFVVLINLLTSYEWIGCGVNAASSQTQYNATTISAMKAEQAASQNASALGKSFSTRGSVKTAKVKGDKRNHLVMNESDYGSYLGLMSVENAYPERNAICKRRLSDNKFACFPDVIYIGTSKSGTTSMVTLT